VTRRQNRVFVALRLPSKVPDLLTRTLAIIDACSKHPLLKNPTPSMAELTVLNQELRDAHTNLGLVGKAGRTARDVKETALRRGLSTLGKCVEDQANLDIAHAPAFINAAHMFVRNESTRRKKPFDVSDGDVSGSIVVDVLSAGDNATYEWQISLDGGKTFVVAKITKQCKTTLTGLPAGTYVHIRCSILVKTGVVRMTDTIIYLVK